MKDIYEASMAFARGSRTTMNSRREQPRMISRKRSTGWLRHDGKHTRCAERKRRMLAIACILQVASSASGCSSVSYCSHCSQRRLAPPHPQNVSLTSAGTFFSRTPFTIGCSSSARIKCAHLSSTPCSSTKLCRHGSTPFFERLHSENSFFQRLYSENSLLFERI